MTKRVGIWNVKLAQLPVFIKFQIFKIVGTIFSFLYIFFALILSYFDLFSQTDNTPTEIYWSTWDSQVFNGSQYKEPGTKQVLQGLDATGQSSSKAALYKGSSNGYTRDGDLIELGFFKLGSAANTTSDLFAGVWTPLTSKTTIGHRTAASGTGVGGEDGLFIFKTKLVEPGSTNDSYAKTNPAPFGSNYQINDDQPSNLSTNIGLLNTAGTSARLGIRFYDISSSANTGGLTAANGTSRYNTIMNNNWAWVDTDAGGAAGSGINMSLHDPSTSGSGAVYTSDLKFEFDNSSAKATSLIGTSDQAVLSDDFVATVTHYDGSSGLALNTIGSTIVSGLTGSGTLTDGGSGKTLTLHSNAGNIASNAYSFGGTITGDTKVFKSGEGEQKLTSTLSVTDTIGFVYIDDGIFTLAPGSTGVSQSMEYLTSATSLGSTDPIFALDNDNGADQTVTFGLTDSSHASTDREFKGKVYLSDSGTNTVEVSSNTASGDYAKTQILSGVISGSSGGTAQAGSAKLKKTGVGRLQLTGANTFNGGVDIDDGALVVGNNTGAGSGTVTINKGKLEVSSAKTMANTIQGGSSNSKKSIIGGKGTVSSNLIIGDASGEIDVLAPGQGISTSLTETTGLSKNQAPLGNVHAGGVADSIGTFSTTGNLTLAGGGVFDWEIKDFHGGSAGSDWDVLAFNNLTFDAFGSNTKFTINILGLDSIGNAGAPADWSNFTGKTGTNGFKFLDGSAAPTWNGWDGANDDGTNDINNYFDIRVDDYAFRTNHWHGDWSVYYDNNDFYLQFSVVPEPSTYIMVTGLLILPGYQCIRRFRKRFKVSVTNTDEV